MIQELGQLKERLSSELQQFGRSGQQLQLAASRFEDARESVESLSQKKEGQKCTGEWRDAHHACDNGFFFEVLPVHCRQYNPPSKFSPVISPSTYLSGSRTYICMITLIFFPCRPHTSSALDFFLVCHWVNSVY